MKVNPSENDLTDYNRRCVKTNCPIYSTIYLKDIQDDNVLIIIMTKDIIQWKSCWQAMVPRHNLEALQYSRNHLQCWKLQHKYLLKPVRDKNK